MNKELWALKGNLIWAEKPGEMKMLPGGYILMEGEEIKTVAQSLPAEYADVRVEDYGDSIITPSFSDMHLHAPQFPMMGMAMDLQLLEWLQNYAFPTEARYAEDDFARRTYKMLARELIARGTTRVCIFSSLHRRATNILMDELEAVGITGYAGKVNMDRNGGENLQETTEESIEETIRWIEENADRKLVKPMLTPRFIPSCTDELMEALGKIAKEHPEIPTQSHLSENLEEIEWVKQLHPDCTHYYQAYEKYGLWKDGTVMAHCVYCDEKERRAMKDAGVWAIHCPDSNTNIASGIAPIRILLDEGVKVAMGSDVAGGAKLSMPEAATDAVRVSRLRWLFSGKKEQFLSIADVLYLITGAGQEYFGAKAGFGAGDKLHAVVLDDAHLAYNPAITLDRRLERIFYQFTTACVKAVYSEGVKRV